MLNVLSFSTICKPRQNRSCEQNGRISLLSKFSRSNHQVAVQHQRLAQNGLQSHGLLAPLLDDRHPDAPLRARQIAAAELICFENPRIGRPYDVASKLPEFTCPALFRGIPTLRVTADLPAPVPALASLKDA